MQLYFLIAGSIVLSFLDYCLIKHKKILQPDKKINLKGIKPNGYKQVVCYIAIPLTIFSVVLMLRLFYQSGTIFTAKRMCVTALLWPIAISDYKELKIPNNFILCGIGLRLIILIPELIFHHDTVLITIVGEGLAIIGTAFICIVCIFVSKGSLGMGDMKLLMVMSSFLGIEGIINSLFVSLFFSFFASIYLLVFKKKQKSYAIPFAPFIMVGTIVSIILTGF